MQTKLNLIITKLANSKLIFNHSVKNNTPNLNAITIRLKKALKIIHNYHSSNKRILFIGNPAYVNNKLTRILKKTKHIFVPRHAWTAGQLSRRHTHGRNNWNIKKFNINKLKKSSLTVIIDQFIEITALNEVHSLKIPIIALNSEFNMLNELSDFKIPAKLVPVKSSIGNHLFYSLLLSILKEDKKRSKYLKIFFKKRHKRFIQNEKRKKWEARRSSYPKSHFFHKKKQSKKSASYSK